MLKPFKILEERELPKAGLINTFEVDLETPDGNNVTWGYAAFPEMAVVLPVDDEGNVYLKQEWRLSRNTFVWEPVSGKVDVESPTEQDVIDTAYREIQEEVGMKAEKMEFLLTMHSHNHMKNKIHLFLATGLSESKLPGDEYEILEVEKMPFAEAFDKVMNQQEPNGQSAVIFLLAKQKLGL